MKKIDDLTVSVTYKVGLGDIEVPENVLSGLEKIAEECGWESSQFIDDYDVLEAVDWLQKNIKEDDCHSWSYDIYELETEE